VWQCGSAAACTAVVRQWCAAAMCEAVCGNARGDVCFFVFDNFCPSRKLSAARKQLEKTLMNKLHVNTHQYNQPYLQSKHPIEEIPNSKLYPYTTNLHHE
jgi:hypothetical protein